MKKLLLAAAASILMTGAASAADMAPRYTKAPPAVAEVWSWTGFYVGGFVGWAGDREDAVSTALPSPGFGAPAVGGADLAGFGLLPTAHNLNRDGFIGGAYAGYNWQSGQWLLGVEADVAYLDRTTSNAQALIQTFGLGPPQRGVMTVTADGHWLGSVRGRVGVTFNKVLLYATGGVAFRDDSGYSAAVVPNAVAPDLNGWPGGVVRFGGNQVGYAAGVGGEWMISPNWILRAEYLHYGFKGATGTLGVVADTCTAAVNCRFVVSTSDRNIDTARVGIAYKFGGPVVAKY